jgi:hypothetical protein
MKSIPQFVWVAPAILLVIAVARLPYGYYTLTRIVTCGAAILIAVVGFKDRPVVPLWAILMMVIAVLFNPLFPINLARSTWFYLDLGAAVIFVSHLLIVRQGAEGSRMNQDGTTMAEGSRAPWQS